MFYRFLCFSDDYSFRPGEFSFGICVFLWVPCTFSLSLTLQSDEMEVALLKAILDGVDHPWMGLTKASR